MLLSLQIHIPYYILDNQFVQIYLNVGFKHMFFWYTFLDPHLNTHYLNIEGVCPREISINCVKGPWNSYKGHQMESEIEICVGHTFEHIPKT